MISLVVPIERRNWITNYRPFGFGAAWFVFGSDSTGPLRPKYPIYITYTGASWSGGNRPCRIPDIHFGRSSGSFSETLSPGDPTALILFLLDASAIYGAALFGLSDFVAWQDRISGCQVAAYVGNGPSSNGAARRSENYHIAQDSVLMFRHLAMSRSISVW